MNDFAVVVVSPSPNTGGAASQQQGCDYSEPVDPGSETPTYQCYTAAQYQAQQNAIAQQQAQQAVELKHYWATHWADWAIGIPVGFLALFVVMITFDMITDTIHKKRHPQDYDAFGFRKPKDPWGFMS